MTKVTLPSQNIRMDTPTGIDPVWYDKLQALAAKVNSLETFFAAGGYQTSTFVPVLTSAGGTPPTFTNPALSGLWVRVGNVMFVNITGSNTAGGTPGAGAQQLSISLPFAVRSVALPAKAIMGTFVNGANEQLVVGQLVAGAAVAPLFKQAIAGSNSNLVALTGADFNNVSRSVYWRFYYGVD